MAQDWLLQFFCLILMKKRPKIPTTIAYSLLYPSQIKTKNTTKTFWRQICYAPICLYFLSFFPPAYPPAHNCSTRPAQMRAKTANPRFFFESKNSFAPKNPNQNRNSKTGNFQIRGAKFLTLYKNNTKKSF